MNKFKLLVGGGILALANFAHASTASSSGDDVFNGFKETIHSWTNGGLGTGIALLTLRVGAGMGVARNSPMPALSGVGSAAFLKWGPDIIVNMVSGGILL